MPEKSRKKLMHVVGARPNFMKIAPLLRELQSRDGIDNILVHTGQHYDQAMSTAFFVDLGISEPDFNLDVGSGTHGFQTAKIMMSLEPIILAEKPDTVIVVGDVNSTLAAALTAAKLHIPVAHIEAGLRSHDRSMPEEINRVLTDQISQLLMTPSEDANENLLAEGIASSRIYLVGNIMIDTLEEQLPRAREEHPLEAFGVEPGNYGVVTLHRPSNVDSKEQITEIVVALEEIARELRLLFPMHPRTKERLENFGLSFSEVETTEPLSYRAMLHLQSEAALVLTDSGGIQEETTVLGVPCLTLRSSTERPITINEGTNRLVPERSTSAILDAFESVKGFHRQAKRPKYWDGRASLRIADLLEPC